MTAGFQAAAGTAATGGQVVAITVGTDGSSRGYDSGFGSRSPTTLLGLTINRVTLGIVSGDFSLRLTGTTTQTAIRRLTIQRGVAAGSVTVLESGSATFSASGGNSTWTWSATNVAWQVADEGTVRNMVVSI